MALLKFNPFTDSKTFQFKDPDTGHVYKASSREGLLRQILDYREQNRLPEIESLREVVDHYLCLLPENAGSCQYETNQKRGFLTYAKGGLMLLKKVFYGEHMMVPQEVAEKRAAICLRCPLNRYPEDASRGMVDAWADSVALHSTNDRHTSVDALLHECAACKCVLKAKVFYKGTRTTKTVEAIWSNQRTNYDAQQQTLQF